MKQIRLALRTQANRVIRWIVFALCLSAALPASSQAQTELITNGGFETTGAGSGWGWQDLAANGWWNISNQAGAYAGNRYQYLGRAQDGETPAHGAEGLLYQDITIPAGATSCTLSFWNRITTVETGPSVYDTMAVQLRNTSNTVLVTLRTYSNLDATSGWVQRSLSITGRAGQTVRLTFHGKTDSSKETVFRVDNVSVLATVPSPALPDLVISSITATPTSGNPGASISVTVTVKNNGTGSAASSTTRIRLASSPTITPNDPILDTFTAGALPAGQSVTYTRTVTVPSVQNAGSYYIGATANADSGVTESDGNNNQKTTPFAVTTPIVVAPSISSVSPNPITADIANGLQTITINGSNFVNKPAVHVTWEAGGGKGKTLLDSQVTFVGSSQLKMSIQLGIEADRWTVKVTNPDGKDSNSSPFIVNAPNVTPGTRPDPSTAPGIRFSLPLSADSPSHYYFDRNATAGVVLAWNGVTTDDIPGGAYDGHRGTDFSGLPRNTPVYAAAAGILMEKKDGLPDGSLSEKENPNGNHVRINHGNDSTGTPIISVYLHLNAGSVTSKGVGSQISAGEQIGGVGTSGLSSGLHLHFETQRGIPPNRVPFDPYPASGESSWWVSAAALPDLVITSITATPTSGNPGASISVTVTVKNNGTGSAASSTTRIRLASSPTITPNDPILDTFTAGALPAGQSVTYTRTVTVSSGQNVGIYYMGATANADSVVTESDGNNNQKTTPFAVTTPIVVAPSISSVSPNPITADIANGLQAITINGSNFADKPSITLTWTDQPAYALPVERVTYVSANTLTIAIHLGAAADTWTVKATNPNGQASEPFIFQVNAPSGAGNTISRSAVIDTAKSYAEYQWVCSSSNANAGYNDFQPGVTYTGVAYNWDGFDSFSSFQTKMSTGVKAGDSKQCVEGVSNTTWGGVDCSGFISRCWNTTRKYSTTDLHTICTQILWTELKPGDVLNSSQNTPNGVGHVRLFDKYDTENSNLVWVYESTTPPFVSHGRVIYGAVSISEMMNTGYLPYRYNSIMSDYTVTYSANDATSGTAPDLQAKMHDVALTLASNTGNLAKSDYSFAGWNTVANGSGTNFAEGGSYIANESVTLYAKWTPSGTIATPGFSPDDGSYSGSSVNVTVTCGTAGATIHYTINGSEPTEGSAAVASGGMVTVPVPGTLRAKAWKTGMNPSATKSATYAAQVQTGSLSVTIYPAGAVNAGARWRVNGGAWQNSSATVSGLSVGTHVVDFNVVSGYAAPGSRNITVTSGPTTMASGTYTALAPVATPTFSPDGGVHAGSTVTVVVSCTTTGATMHYTINGSEPTEGSAAVASGGTVTVPVPGTLKAKAWKTGMNPSATKSAGFDAQQMATLTVVANPPEGGTVSGDGVFPVGSQRQISATANNGWTFTGWNNGNMQAVRTVTMSSGGATYTAMFSLQAGWDAGHEQLGGGWRRLNWFGSYIPVGNGWYWHNRFGYFFISANSTPDKIHMLTTDMGWLHTSNGLYPYLFRFSDRSWLWYRRDSRNPRWFLNLRGGQWERQ